ncbi:unnamed protein product, partial [marine sediment metagenome]
FRVRVHGLLRGVLQGVDELHELPVAAAGAPLQIRASGA